MFLFLFSVLIGVVALQVNATLFFLTAGDMCASSPVVQPKKEPNPKSESLQSESPCRPNPLFALSGFVVGVFFQAHRHHPFCKWSLQEGICNSAVPCKKHSTTKPNTQQNNKKAQVLFCFVWFSFCVCFFVVCLSLHTTHFYTSLSLTASGLSSKRFDGKNVWPYPRPFCKWSLQ